MCGRYTLTRFDRVIEIVPNITIKVDIGKEISRWNIAPTQNVLAATNRAQPTLEKLHWGLIPPWAKDPAIASKLINARAETLAEKPAFKKALEARRCLVFADGFYEWRKDPTGKTPMCIRLKTRDLFAFAGLWETWLSPTGDPVNSCTIITTAPNDLMATIHNRMPAILPLAVYREWLAPAPRPPADFAAILRPYPAELMEAYPVSRRVNSPAIDSPDLIVPAAPAPPPQGSLFT